MNANLERMAERPLCLQVASPFGGDLRRRSLQRGAAWTLAASLLLTLSGACSVATQPSRNTPSPKAATTPEIARPGTVESSRLEQSEAPQTEPAPTRAPEREWPPCEGPAGRPLNRDWPEVTLQQAAGHAVQTESALVNVRAQLTAITPADFSRDDNQYWWPAMNTPFRSYVVLHLGAAGSPAALEVLAEGGCFNAGLELGRTFEFGVRLCEGNTGRMVAELQAYEPVGRVSGGDPAECDQPGRESWPSEPLEKLLTDSRLSGGFSTKGWIVECFEPAPCRARYCKPQGAPSMLVSTRQQGGTEMLRLSGSCGTQFKPGQQYDLSIVLRREGCSNDIQRCPRTAAN